MADHTAPGGVAAQVAALQENLPAGVMQQVLDHALALGNGEGGAPDRLRFVGVLSSENPEAQTYLPNFTVLVAPSQGATLASLLSTARYELTQAPAVALLNAGLVDDLRPGNRDAALLRYRVDGSARFGVANLAIRTNQAIFLDDSGSQVAIVTLSAPAKDFSAELDTLFADLIQTITFD